MCFDNSGPSFNYIEAYFVWAFKKLSYSGLTLNYSRICSDNSAEF